MALSSWLISAQCTATDNCFPGTCHGGTCQCAGGFEGGNCIEGMWTVSNMGATYIGLQWPYMYIRLYCDIL